MLERKMEDINPKGTIDVVVNEIMKDTYCRYYLTMDVFNDLLKTCNFKTEATGLGKCTMRWSKERHSFGGLNVIAVYNEEIQDNVFRIDAARIGEKTVYEVKPLKGVAVLLKK